MGRGPKHRLQRGEKRDCLNFTCGQTVTGPGREIGIPSPKNSQPLDAIPSGHALLLPHSTAHPLDSFFRVFLAARHFELGTPFLPYRFDS